MAHAWNGCFQSSRFPTAGQGERSSGNEIDEDLILPTSASVVKRSRPVQQRDNHPSCHVHVYLCPTTLKRQMTMTDMLLWRSGLSVLSRVVYWQASINSCFFFKPPQTTVLSYYKYDKHWINTRPNLHLSCENTIFITTAAIDEISLQTCMRTCVLACFPFAFQGETINFIYAMLVAKKRKDSAVFQNFCKLPLIWLYYCTCMHNLDRLIYEQYLKNIISDTQHLVPFICYKLRACNGVKR